jgi:hypothetical protein
MSQFLQLHHHASHIRVTPVTIFKKGNCILSDAHLSGLSQYAGPMIYTILLSLLRKCKMLKKMWQDET